MGEKQAFNRASVYLSSPTRNFPLEERWLCRNFQITMRLLDKITSLRGKYFRDIPSPPYPDRVERKHPEDGRGDARPLGELKRGIKFYEHDRMQLQSFFMTSERRKLFWKLTPQPCNFYIPRAIRK